MKIILTARFSAVAFLLGLFVTVYYARTGLRIVGVLLPRQVWLVEQTGIWMLSWWLWLLAIFSWMAVLAALMWSYLPGHRINSMLQSGLMVIAATLAIAGIVVWMNVLPFAAGHEQATAFVPLVDAIALALLGSGFFMTGIVTAWIVIDLMRLRLLNRWSLLPGLAAGLVYMATPFLLPHFYSLAAGAFLWLVWMLILALRRTLPSAYVEWQ